MYFIISFWYPECSIWKERSVGFRREMSLASKLIQSLASMSGWFYCQSQAYMTYLCEKESINDDAHMETNQRMLMENWWLLGLLFKLSQNHVVKAVSGYFTCFLKQTSPIVPVVSSIWQAVAAQSHQLWPEEGNVRVKPYKRPNSVTTD